MSEVNRNRAVGQAIKIAYVIDLKITERIGLTIPPNVLVRADKMIR